MSSWYDQVVAALSGLCCGVRPHVVLRRAAASDQHSEPDHDYQEVIRREMAVPRSLKECLELRLAKSKEGDVWESVPRPRLSSSSWSTECPSATDESAENVPEEFCADVIHA
mmetsp:Transcript_16984/g.40023  ORF Transcript_16984/g.40023 Transcript_16984/m.40023 type:complete len:112 (-) Transcript_16984:62-397(-)